MKKHCDTDDSSSQQEDSSTMSGFNQYRDIVASTIDLYSDDFGSDADSPELSLNVDAPVVVDKAAKAISIDCVDSDAKTKDSNSFSTNTLSAPKPKSFVTKVKTTEAKKKTKIIELKRREIRPAYKTNAVDTTASSKGSYEKPNVP